MKAKERHDIKTDKFLETMHNVQDTLSHHGNKIVMVIVTLVALVIIALLINWFLESRQETAARALNEALSQYRLAGNSLVGSQGDEEALAKAMLMLRAVADDHAGTAAAPMASFQLGIIEIGRGDYEKAAVELRAVIDSRHPIYWSLASEELGKILMQEGKYEEASEVFRKVVDSGTLHVPAAFFAWKTGQCYEKLGNTQEAIRYYTKAKDSETLTLDSKITADIERRLSRLNSATEQGSTNKQPIE